MRARWFLVFVILVSSPPLSCTSGPDHVSPVIGDLYWPTVGTISQAFDGDGSGHQPGYYYDDRGDLQFWNGLSSLHRGIDITNLAGTPIMAAAAGTVSVKAYDGSADYGNRVLLDHGHGVYTLYAHLTSFSVADGMVVTRGQVLGTMGNTGNATGSHLHFEVKYAPDMDRLTLTRYIPGKLGERVSPSIRIPHYY